MQAALPFFLTKKLLTIVAIVVAVVAWLIAHATKIQIPLGISKEDALAGLASIGTALGVLGSSPLPGGTLLKTAEGAQAAVTKAAGTLLLLVALGLGLGASSCATVKPVTNTVGDLMPKVNTYVQDAQLVVSTVEGVEKAYFNAKPNADLQKKVEVLIANARVALDAGLRICAATEHLSKSNIIDAFADFRGLYTDVVALLGPYGARRSGGAMGAGSGPPGPDVALPQPPLLMELKRS